MYDVTEYVYRTSRVNAVVWLVRVDKDSRHDRWMLAVRSPLTGAYLLTVFAGAGAASYRYPDLREARRAAIGGNGRRYGGHSTVCRVYDVMPHSTVARSVDYLLRARY
jgi:hypothetical protein